MEFAEKFALLQTADPHVTIPPGLHVDRMARLRHFAERDVALATDRVARHVDHLVKADSAVLLAALAQLGELSAFWACLQEALIAQFNARVNGIGKAERVGAPPVQEAKSTSFSTPGRWAAKCASGRCPITG